MKKYTPLLIGLASLFVCVVVSLFLSGQKFFFYNYTNSLPKGFYVRTLGQVHRGDLVAFKPPPYAEKMIRDRHYLRDDGFLMKKIIGIEGDSICTERGSFYVHGVNYGGFVNADAEGRTLPRYYYCGRIKKGDYIVGLAGENNSFDSRYFGPVKKENIIGRIALIWRFDQ